MKTNNFSEMKASANKASNELRNLNIMYFVNQLNKLARKNEYCEAVNVREFGQRVKDYAIGQGIELSANDYFTAKLFTLVNGRSCYKHTAHKKASGAFAIDIDVITWKHVTMTLQGLISAYKYIMSAEAKAEDRKAREAEREARKLESKAESKAKREARKRLKAEQEQARKDYAANRISPAEFAAIMIKAA